MSLQRGKELLKKLYEIGIQTESKEADEIRDELDPIWNKFTNEELVEFLQYSAELRDNKKPKPNT